MGLSWNCIVSRRARRTGGVMPQDQKHKELTLPLSACWPHPLHSWPHIYMYGREHGYSRLPGLITLQRRADSLPLGLTWKNWRKVWFVWLELDAQSILNRVIWYMHGTWEPIPVYLVCSKFKRLSSLLLLIGVKYVYKTTLG